MLALDETEQMDRAAYRKHLIGLIENEHFHGISLEYAALDHILHTTGSTNDHLRPVLKRLHVIANACTSDTGMTLNVHEITNGHDDFLNLLRKLASRRQDQRLTSFHVRVELLQN